MVKLIQSGAWLDGLVMLGLTGALVGLGWLILQLGYWFDARQTPPAGPRERVRSRPGYTVRVGADSVQLLSRPTRVVFPMAISILLLGAVSVSAPLVTSILTARDPSWRQSSRLVRFFDRVAWNGSYFAATGALIPLGLGCLVMSQRRTSLVLEARGPLRYRLERWPFKSTTWELDPKAFGAILVRPSGAVVLLQKPPGKPRHLFNSSHLTHLEEDIGLAEIFLGVLGAKEEPRFLGPDTPQDEETTETSVDCRADEAPE